MGTVRYYESLFFFCEKIEDCPPNMGQPDFVQFLRTVPQEVER